MKGSVNLKTTDKEFYRIVNYVKGRYGVNLIEKRNLIEGRLENYLVINGFRSFDEFMDRVESDASQKYANELISMLTTNHTFFLREPEHFEFFKNTILPEWSKKEERKKELRVWSAAASTGEEPYTLAMIMKNFFELNSSSWDTRVLATDISMKVLEKAACGEYAKEQVETLPENWRRRFFIKKIDGNYKVNEMLRKEVIFRQFNLMSEYKFKGKFHVIFLRNVLIYFDNKTKEEVIKKMVNCLEKGGYLFIGTTETINIGEKDLKYIRPSVYKKI